MPTISLPNKPPPFACVTCQAPAVSAKAGPGCQSCPSFPGTHYYPFNDGPEQADVLVVGDVPEAPRLRVFDGKVKPGPVELYHASFKDDGGRILKTAVGDLQRKQPLFKDLQFRYTYAVRCAVESPNKATLHACRTYLKAEIGRAYISRGTPHKPLVVLACGVHSLHALGIPVRSEKDASGRVFENVRMGDVTLTVVFTRSLKAIAVGVGKYSSLLADVERTMRIVTSAEIRTKSREELSKDYVYPTNLDEVRALVDRVIAYTGNPEIDPKDWAIAADTETNTLHPHWDQLQLVAVSFAWNEGQAACVPLWHKDTPYDPQAAYQEVCRLLRAKPLIWFNGKYDYKVFWKKGWPLGDVGRPAWDTMLAEHVLEEDKKGQYSLKYLSKQDLPELAGYEDKLHEELEKEDEATEQRAPVEGKKDLRLLPAVAEALAYAVTNKHVKSPSFQLKTLEKALAKPGLPEEAKPLLTLLLNAKKNGEFTARAGQEEKKAKKRKGGFENIPLPELCFYAAVDADATRRLALRQGERMDEEDAKFARWRKQVQAELTYGPPDDANAERSVKVLYGGGDAPDLPSQIDHAGRSRPLHRLVKEDYLPRQRELAKIEYQGVNIDRNYLEWGSRALDHTLSDTQQRLYELAGESFKVGSTKKLVSLLFDVGVGYVHPDAAMAQKLADENPDEVRYVGGRIMYRSHHYTAKGAEQVNEAALKSLVSRYKCPMANLLLSLRKADKARNSFFKNIDILSTMFGDGRLHPGYNLAGTSTGRLSSSSGVPDVGFNNQNIPKNPLGALKTLKGELVLKDDNTPVFEGVKCKKLFIPDCGDMVYGNADAKGAEVSIFAGYAMDAALIEALIAGMDAHCFFASQSLNPDLVAEGKTGNDRRLALDKAGIDDLHAWSYEDFKGRDKLKKEGIGKLKKDGGTADPKDRSTWANPDLVDYAERLDKLRDNIKRLVFGLLYGAGVRKIAEVVGIKPELAEKIKNLLFNKFPTLEKYIQQTHWEMRMFGIVETYQGRRRRFSLGKYAPSGPRSKAERQAVNFKIQATNSDIVMTVLCWIAEALEGDMGGRLLGTVHDSIMFQVPKKYAHQMPELFRHHGTARVRELCPWLPVPYRWELLLGPNYGDCEDADKYLAGMPPSLPEPELEGYSSEEQFDDLRNPDAFELPPRTKPLPKRA